MQCTFLHASGAHDLRIAPPLPLREVLGRPALASSLVSIACRYPGAGPDAGAPGFVDTLCAERDLPSPVPLQVFECRPSRPPACARLCAICRGRDLLRQPAHQQGYAPVVDKGLVPARVWCLQRNQPHQGMHSHFDLLC